MTMTTPAWLHDRVNDPYGTPNRHAFWETVAFEDVGNWRIFQSEDGVWRAYDRRYNAWWHFPTRDEAVARANGGSVDVWA